MQAVNLAGTAIGADPRKVTRDMTEVYGVGAFLAAGCQIYKMAVDTEADYIKSGQTEKPCRETL